MSTSERTPGSRRRRGWADQRGFTLVESLIALGLLALGAAAIGEFMTSQFRHSANNHLATTAYALAADEIERIRSLPFAEMRGSSRDVPSSGVVFDVVSTVSDGVPATNMKSVDVRVSWSSPHGSQSIDLQTVYAQVRQN